ncbi:1,4-dihydroxy-2-naphthoate polyprenyltransferase [Microlunatus parietis]|uniref:1,4-dihydroxy-2-naphthoate octaprenyltransferase n=1 Tax=Microlunatus parietis TaxID=682979 RepID=A0A7Y9I6Y0_9ACTN|nr:1,4-dihydroxy-2-naphthoate polyprenyltransferase [Microlunatus parietis]NYE71418.1 1,4-dihydroxy-2-naphthoate octaprenyltransferase [Microlunatus parietis]
MSEDVTTATPRQWLAGARPQTLPAALTPVIVGSALAHAAGGFALLPALLALLVALALQIGVNYANDYSDGIRGTDKDRVGPLRLVGSGLARPRTVRTAAFVSFGVAAVAGLALVVLSGQWWLIAVGAASILAAWYYTGGRRPYGYLGLGELFVFVFFGLIAGCGTTLVQFGAITPAALVGAAAVGCWTTAILVANNLRDLVGDQASGKLTLAVRLGDRATRILYAGLIGAAAAGLIVVAALTSWWALLALVGVALLVPSVLAVLRGAAGRDLIGVLKTTGRTEVLAALALAIGLVVAGLT